MIHLYNDFWCSDIVSQGKSVPGVVNAPILGSALKVENIPWIKLAQCLGTVASNFIPPSVPGVRIEVSTLGKKYLFYNVF